LGVTQDLGWTHRISIKDEDVQDIVIALAVICDHVSDKDSTWRHY
jgi:hypothetical protein